MAAEYNIDVVLDPGQAVRNGKVVEKSLDNIGNAADRTQQLIKRALALAGVTVGIRELYNLADTYANLQNRIRVVTDTTQQLTTVTAELFRISQETRSSFAGSVELYSRLAISSKELGTTQSQLIDFTKSLNQAIILSGASAQESSAGLIQLSQGMASGTLRGDELRSVLEQLPAVADVIAKSMGVTRGELRAMGEQGKITANTILTAFKGAKEELEDRFAKALVTPSQALQVLKNSLLRVVGAYDQNLGISRVFSSAMIGLSDNIDVLIRSVTALAITLGTILAANAIPKAIIGIRALTAAMAANPVGVLVIALTAVISLLITFSDQIGFTADGFVNLQDVAIAVWNAITLGAAAFVKFFKDNFGFIGVFAKEIFGDINLSVEGVVRFGARMIDRYIGLWLSAFNVITGIFKLFPAVVKEQITNALNGAIGIIETKVNALIGLVNRLFESFGETKRFAEVALTGLPETARGSSEELGKVISEGIKQGMSFAGAQSVVTGIIDDARAIATKRNADLLTASNVVQEETAEVVTKVNTKYKEYLESLAKEAQLLRLNKGEREIQKELLKAEKSIKADLTQEQKALLTARITENQLLRSQAEAYDAIRAPIEDYKTSLASLNTLLAEGRINQQEYNMAVSQTGLSQALQGVRGELGTEGGEELNALQDQLLERSNILQQAREADLISEQEFFTLSLEANRRYNEEVAEIEQERFRLQLQMGEQTFSSLADIAKVYAGEQSGIYKSLFAVSKAFAIADATVQIAGAIAKAANSGPFPANLGAMAAVAASTANLVGTIQGAAFQNGGSFKVGGSGGADSQTVAFRASPNETVSIKTPGQERMAQAPAPVPQQNGGGVRIINVVDPELVNDFMSSPQGEEVLINSIQRNQGQVKQILKG